LEEKLNKKIKFKSGTKLKVISREDCVSDESWLKILELLSKEKSKKIAAQNQKARREKKLKSLKGLINKLEEKEEFKAAKFLQV